MGGGGVKRPPDSSVNPGPYIRLAPKGRKTRGISPDEKKKKKKAALLTWSIQKAPFCLTGTDGRFGAAPPDNKGKKNSQQKTEKS